MTARILKLAGSAMIFLAMTLAFATAQENTLAPPRKNAFDYTQLAKVPSKAAMRRNPIENDADSVAAGAKLFDLHCAECHGDMAQGGHKAPSLLVRQVQDATPGTLFWLLTNGVVRRGMPVWSKLPEPQRWQLVTFVKSLAPADRPQNPPDAPNDPRPPGDR